jgi:hypothetical protein
LVGVVSEYLSEFNRHILKFMNYADSYILLYPACLYYLLERWGILM